MIVFDERLTESVAWVTGALGPLWLRGRGNGFPVGFTEDQSTDTSVILTVFLKSQPASIPICTLKLREVEGKTTITRQVIRNERLTSGVWSELVDLIGLQGRGHHIDRNIHDLDRRALAKLAGPLYYQAKQKNRLQK